MHGFGLVTTKPVSRIRIVGGCGGGIKNKKEMVSELLVHLNSS